MKRLVYILLLFGVHATAYGQGQLVFGQVSVVQNCVWSATPQSGLANLKVQMYQDLKALQITAPIFTQYRISVIDSLLIAPTQPQVATIYRQIIFSNVSVVTDFIYGFVVGEQSCTTWEASALTAMVALNDTAVDAVLTTYKVRLVSESGVTIFPR